MYINTVTSFIPHTYVYTVVLHTHSPAPTDGSFEGYNPKLVVVGGSSTDIVPELVPVLFEPLTSDGGT